MEDLPDMSHPGQKGEPTRSWWSGTRWTELSRPGVAGFLYHSRFRISMGADSS